MKNELTALEKATAVRDSLNAKLEAAKGDLKVLNARRDALAFEAHANGGAALAELDKITKSLIVAVAAIDSLNVAVVEASRRIDEAQREAELDVESRKAARAMIISSGLAKRAERMDRALKILADEAMAVDADLNELNHQLGCSHPNNHQWGAHGSRCAAAGLQFTPLRLEFLAPHERRSFTQAIADYSITIERWAEGRLLVKEAAE